MNETIHPFTYHILDFKPYSGLDIRALMYFKKICKILNLPQNIIHTRSRNKDIIFAKYLFILITRTLYGIKTEKLGHFLNIDHSTVSIAYNKYVKFIQINDKKTIEALKLILEPEDYNSIFTIINKLPKNNQDV